MHKLLGKPTNNAVLLCVYGCDLVGHEGLLCCCRLELNAEELPEAFEGEERSMPGVADVLQLISGRQLLGVVRERQDAHLPGDFLHFFCCRCCFVGADAVPSRCRQIPVAALLLRGLDYHPASLHISTTCSSDHVRSF